MTAPGATPPSVEQRITDYLASGGLFNPELANHDAVRDLLIDARAELAAAEQRWQSLDKMRFTAESLYEAEYAVVSRVWKALGIDNYEAAGGKTIDQIVAERCNPISDEYRWIPVSEPPKDEQKVTGYWRAMDCAETVTYHASDSPIDGHERWINAWGEETDAPDLWKPWEAPQ